MQVLIGSRDGSGILQRVSSHISSVMVARMITDVAENMIAAAINFRSIAFMAVPGGRKRSRKKRMRLLLKHRPRKAIGSELTQKHQAGYKFEGGSS